MPRDDPESFFTEDSTDGATGGSKDPMPAAKSRPKADSKSLPDVRNLAPAKLSETDLNSLRISLNDFPSQSASSTED